MRVGAVNHDELIERKNLTVVTPKNGNIIVMVSYTHTYTHVNMHMYTHTPTHTLRDRLHTHADLHMKKMPMF